MRLIVPPLFALVLVTSLSACFDTTPPRFSSLAELNAYQEEDGYVMIEHFGDAWPAQVITERQYRDRVNVILANSQTYSFDDFEGYRLRVVTLKGERAAEIVVVYRSREKR